jgi:molybdopterin/thiamine biosynthesis adenylyltransferase
LLEQIGLEGQHKLKASSALIVGLGGLGSPIAIYLASAGVGKLGLVDNDLVDLSNLQRQVIHTTSGLERKKVTSARDHLSEMNPCVDIEIYDELFTPENALEISTGYDLIVDGCDNFATRYLMNDVCVLTHKPYIYGSVSRFEGQASVFWADKGPCYRCLFPEPPSPDSPLRPSQAGIFNALPGTIGTIQATEALKLLLKIGEPLIGRLLLYDALAMSFEEFILKKNPSCKSCSGAPGISQLDQR